MKSLCLWITTLIITLMLVGCAISNLPIQPTMVPNYAVVIEKNDADLDGDGIADRLVVYAEHEKATPFYVDIYLSASGEPLQVAYMRCPFDTYNKICVADMTGDGKPDIVFPDLGGISTRGEICPLVLILNLNSGRVTQVPVFGDSFFGGNTFFLDGSGSDMEGGSAIMHIINRASGQDYWVDFSDTLKQNPPPHGVYYAPPVGDAYTIRGDIVELVNSKFGLRIMTVIEVYAYLETSDDDPLHLGMLYLYSTLEYTDGVWHVVDETLEWNTNA